MVPPYLRPVLIILVIILILTSCQLAWKARSSAPVDSRPSPSALTLAVLGTQAVLPPGEFQTAVQDSVNLQAEPLIVVSTPELLGPVVENAVVLEDALCQRQRGRGGVISSVKKGQRVALIGRKGSYLAVANPRYQVGCWLEKRVLQVDADFDILTLPIMEGVPRLKYAITPKP